MSSALHKTIEPLRHMCRCCGRKLAEPTDRPREAFCDRGCYRTFYRSHCLVCEADIPAIITEGRGKGGRSNQKFCGEKHQQEAARKPELYAAPARFAEKSKSLAKLSRKERRKALAADETVALTSYADEMGLEELPERGRPPPAEGWRGDRVPADRKWAWEKRAGSWFLLDAAGEIKARVARQDEGWRVIWPRAVPITEGEDLEQVKGKAVSLALAALPLDKATAARVRQAEKELQRYLAER